MKLRATSAMLLLLWVITLLACGGSGGSVGVTPFETLSVSQITAKVNIPTVSGTALTSLKVWTSSGEDSPAATGQVPVKVMNNGPQYTEVRNSAGKILALAFLGGNRTEVNHTTTAEVFAYFAVGGPLQRGSANSPYVMLNAVKNLPGFANVVSAVTSTFNAQGFVSADDPAIKSALEAMVSSVVTTAKKAPATGRGPKVEPTTAISGLEINDDVNEQIQITNTAFRRAHMWLVRTGYKDSNGNKRDLVEGVASEAITMPGRYGGKVDSATGLISGQYSWESAEMSPHPVSSDVSTADNEEEIYYDLVTVGVGRTAGDFDKLTQEQFKKWQELVYWSAYLDFYVPVFANLALPLNGDAVDSLAEFISKHETAKAFISTCPSSMPTVASLTAQGKFPNAVRAFVSSSQMPAIAEMTADLMIEWAQSYGSGLFVNNQDLQNRIHLAQNNIGSHNLADAIDGMAPFLDIQNADQANIFKITSAASSIKLVSDNDEIGLEDTANIEVIIKNFDSTATYRYEWKVDNSNFFLQDVNGKSTDESPGGILKSTEKKVFIGNLSQNEGTPTITCTVYKNNAVAGVATTRVQFRDKVKEGTARFIVRHHLEPNPNGSPTSNYGVAALAEIDVMPGADHYAVVIEKENGEDIMRLNWAATSRPPITHPGIWASKPSNVYWISFDATYLEGYVANAVANQAITDITAGYNNAYKNVKIKVTCYFD